MAEKIKVLIVDDSALIRQMLKEIFSTIDEVEVVGTAADPYIARDKIKRLNPDVLTLDVEMPRMNGLQFLGNLMRLRPMPVVMVSTLTEAGAPETLEALEIGAVDFIAKPKAQDQAEFQQFAASLKEKILMAAKARVRAYTGEKKAAPQPVSKIPFHKWICIGSSTGGTEAIREVLNDVPVNCPPIVITQHIPGVFSSSFAMRLNRALPMEVVEAEEGMEVRPGRVIIARGDYHLRFRKEGTRVVCQLDDGERVNRHKPSVEVMFDSLQQLVPANKLVSVMLTGMGRDGAEAMKRLKDGGAASFAQDEASSVVWGMPKAAYDCGAVDELISLPNMATRMLKAAQQNG